MIGILKTNRGKKGLIKLDPRTVLLLLVLSNAAVFMMPSVRAEILLMALVFILAMLCGVYSFSFKMLIAYIVLLGVEFTCVTYFSGAFSQTAAVGAQFMRKVFPCAMLGSILILATQVSKFMAALGRMRTPKSILIPLTVMLRYFPAIGEDRRQIKKAMRMRDVTPGFISFLKHPSRTAECIYVPLMMSASRRADELSAAAVTRGIENPSPRTSMQEVRFRAVDLICVLIAVGYIMCIFGGVV